MSSRARDSNTLELPRFAGRIDLFWYGRCSRDRTNVRNMELPAVL